MSQAGASMNKQPIQPEFYDGPVPGQVDVPDTTNTQRHEKSPDPISSTRQSPIPDTGSSTRIISIALDILSFRLILLVSVVISGALFLMVAMWPDWIRLAAAAVFAICVTGPLAWLYRG